MINNRKKITLHEAAQNGDLETCRHLIAQGVDVNKLDDLNLTPLHWAALGNKPSIVDALINANADLNGFSAYAKMTPLAIAAERGQIEICRRLAAAGADVSIPDEKGWPALKHVILFGEGDSLEVCRLLVDYGASLDQKDEFNRTAIHWAASKGKAALCALLIERGADPNLQDARLNTPLHLGLWNNHTLDKSFALCQVFFEANANLELENIDGTTVAQIISRNKKIHDYCQSILERKHLSKKSIKNTRQSNLDSQAETDEPLLTL